MKITYKTDRDIRIEVLRNTVSFLSREFVKNSKAIARLKQTNNKLRCKIKS